MKSNLSKGILSTGLAISLIMQSCTLHPRYARPNMAPPEQWRVSLENVSASQDLYWWKALNDPVLDALIAEALESNKDLKVAINRVDEFIAQLGIARSQYYPQISGNVLAGREKVSTNSSPLLPGTSATNNAYGLLLNASYLLDVWGQVRSANEVALANLLSQVENRRTVVLTLVSAVASSYVLLKQFDKQLKIAQETLSSRKQYYDLAVVRFELGLTSDIQVQQAQAEVDNAATKLRQFKIAVQQQENLITVLIGKSSATIKRGLALDDLAIPPEIPEGIPSAILNQRPDILAAEQTLISANANIGIAKANFFPQFNLTGQYGVESTKLSNLLTTPSSLWQYGASIIQEIFTGGNLTNQLRLSEAQKRTALYQYESTVLNAFKEVNDALIAHKETLEITKIQKERVRTLTEYLKLATLRYENGQDDYLTVLDAERQLFDAELDYAQYLAQSYTTYIDLYKVFAGPWVINADQSIAPSN